MTLSYWRPSRCPKCRESYVNWVGSEILQACALIGLGVAAGILGIQGLREEHFLLLVLLLLPARALFVRPMRYRDFKPYGERTWLANAVIFVVLPLVLMVVLLAAAMIFRWGQ
jgi:hypothetical protein